VNVGSERLFKSRNNKWRQTGHHRNNGASIASNIMNLKKDKYKITRTTPQTRYLTLEAQAK